MADMLGTFLALLIVAVIWTAIVAGFHYLFKYFWRWRFTDKEIRPVIYTAIGMLILGFSCVIPGIGSQALQSAETTTSTISPEQKTWVMVWYRIPKQGRSTETRAYYAQIENYTDAELIFTVTWGKGSRSGQATFRGKRIEQDVYGGTWWQNNPDTEGTWELRRVKPDVFIGWEQFRDKDPVALYLVAKEDSK